jgi:RNA polymerase sigma-70 factor (ECF subfamily)
MDDSATSTTSASLLRALQADDRDAWRQLAELYGPMVYTWCRQAGLTEVDTADVAQNVFAAVFRNVKRFRRQQPGDSFRGWLWQITRNEVLMFLRGRAKEPQVPGGTAAQQALAQLPALLAAEAEPSLTDTRVSMVRRAMALLRVEFEPQTWQAFWRTTVDGRPAPEAAEELGMTPVGVRQAKHRVLKRLREFLAEG